MVIFHGMATANKREFFVAFQTKLCQGTLLTVKWRRKKKPEKHKLHYRPADLEE